MTTETADMPDHHAPDEEGVFSRFVGGVGAPFVMIGAELLDIFKTFFLTAYYTFARPIRWREVLRQCNEIGVKSLFFISVVMGFLGAVMIVQAGYQAEKIVGDLSMIGAFFLQMMLRELAPTMTATMLATRVGTGIAAEIGSMVVTEQVDALKMNNADPIQYLVVPRFLASILMTVVLAAISLVVCFVASMLVCQAAFDINPRTYYNPVMLGWGDLIIFMMKAIVYGMTVPVIAAQAGLSAFGGSEGVGWATTKAVVNASLAVTFLDFVLSAFGYVFLFD